MRLTRTFLPLLRQSKGRIVNIGSLAAAVNVPLGSGYCMSKGAVRSFTDVLRAEVAPFGVSVSLIEPTAYKTPMGDYRKAAAMVGQSWSRSSDEVRDAYGRDGVEFLMLMFEWSSWLATKIQFFDLGRRYNLDEVVDRVEHALMSAMPWPYYVSGSIIHALFVYVVNVTPREIIDGVYRYYGFLMYYVCKVSMKVVRYQCGPQYTGLN